MKNGNETRFGFAIAPVDKPGTSDADLYAEAIMDAKFGQSLGYESAWALEHHFTDYFPTPSPLLFLAHVAAHCPDLGLGTMVLVPPWYDPIRFVEEIAMLSNLTKGELHLGMGRGTAKLEYDAFNVDMEEARQRYRECWEITQLGLKGEPFTYQGEFFSVPRKVPVRPLPQTERIHFCGAIGSPGSAEIMASLNLPPLCIANFPLHLQKQIIENWTKATQEAGRDTDVTIPIALNCFIADTDEEARQIAKEYLPPFFKLQKKDLVLHS